MGQKTGRVRNLQVSRNCYSSETARVQKTARKPEVTMVQAESMKPWKYKQAPIYSQSKIGEQSIIRQVSDKQAQE